VIRRIFFALLVLLAIFCLAGAGFYLDLLWFDNLGYSSVFWTFFISRWLLRLLAGLFFFLFLFGNLMLLRKSLLQLQNLPLREQLMNSAWGNILTKKRITALFFAISVLLSLFFSSYTGGYWLEALNFINGVSFGISEPIFGQDAGFYVFSLPFFRFLSSFLQTSLIVTLLFVGLLYLLSNPPPQVGRRLNIIPSRGIGHLSLLLAGIFLLKTWDYRLQMFELLFSQRGACFGSGYTDIYAQLPAYWILLGLSFILAVAMIFNYFRRYSRLLPGSIAAIFLVSFLVGGIYPNIVQQFRVEPNELAFERPFLEHNIALTRKAFALDNVTTREYPLTQELTWEGLEAKAGTLKNVRLWDYRPLLQTYNQLQGIRLYYDFFEVDIDRYYIDGHYRQVMLAARELNINRLAPGAQTWVNQRLQYTHGYGLAMSPVAEVTPEGLPRFVARDIPPKLEGLPPLTRPEIYYGQLTHDYVIVNSKTEEFNYPMGDTNVYMRYDGTGGVPVKSLPRRLLFALRFADHRILLSGELQQESRVMFHRNISERVQRIAPFLQYDSDPYLVMHEGRLVWVYDAYTTTSNFPYSQPYKGINYIRNSVKIIIDAYNGSVDFYIADPDDPIILTYQKIFPDLFKPMEEMPAEIRERHLRYPEDIFNIQTRVYAAYHMENPTVFYNREDMWEIPNEKYAGTIQAMEPYYTILQLPEEAEGEYLIIMPFTPTRRDNMIAWMAGRCDGGNYGELVVYEFPKDRVILGPMQVETRIDQNTIISEQLTLWDQMGSHVIRGNLLVLPLDDSLLYIEPVFLQADQSELPELARVIAGFQDRVVMARTLEEALVSLFGEREVPAEFETGPEEPAKPSAPLQTVEELARRAQEALHQAQQKQREGDWAAYGAALRELEDILAQLKEIVTSGR
jgi:uncharacterized membrane protein (UPF0182 family)